MENPVVNINDGQLKGSVRKNIDDENFYLFLGIPYAKPPTGTLRFKAPLPVEAWEGIIDATKEGNNCYQQNMMASGYEGSEDCLFLNVFTKNLPGQKVDLKPVMVYIHGGAFLSGSGSPTVYGPDILMTEDIVLVNINYRVGVLGFLSLKDTTLDVPGNAGLKDQTLALKWVQKNIKFFNGDPDNVTIFGISAGSASVHYHILSPTAHGLFHKAIGQSGTALNPWPHSDPEANSFIKFFGKEPKSEKEFLDILMKASVEEIVEAQDKLVKEKGTILKVFGPVVEKPNRSAFLTKQPIEIIQKGEYNKVPMIFGYTSNEGLLMELITRTMTGLPTQEIIQPIENYIPWQVDLKRGSNSWNQIVQKMENLYYSAENKENKYMAATDSDFVAGIIAAVHNHVQVQNAPVYLYRMSIITNRNTLSQMMQIDPKFGVSHGDDIGYLFTSDMAPFDVQKGSAEDKGIRIFVKLWTNFAKFGNPTPDDKELGVTWKPVDRNNQFFLDIGQELTLGTNPEAERMKLWREIYFQNSKTATFL